MRVNQLLVDPVAAALGQFLDVELARGDHHLLHRSVDHVAVDVDVGKIVVGADLLDLPQGVLQRAPVPQPDVLERQLVVGQVECLERGVGRKRMLRDAIEGVRPPRELDVVPDIRLLSHELVRFDDEAAHIPADHTDPDITGCRRHDRRDEPAEARRGDGVDERQHCAQNERPGNNQHAGERDVSVRVCDAREDRVIVEEALEPSEVHADGEREEDDRDADRQAAPGRPVLVLVPSGEHPRGAGHGDKEHSHRGDDQRHCRQPAREQLPRRQGEEIERHGPVEDRVERRRGAARRVPVERERRPGRHQAGAGDDRDCQRHADREEAQHRFARQRDGLTLDQNRAAADSSELRRLEGEK